MRIYKLIQRNVKISKIYNPKISEKFKIPTI